MKIAISGKGGVGKTLLASLLSKAFAEAGYSVLAIDADPDANLAANLGFPHPDKITPISELSDIIEERVGAKPGQSGSFFKLNPKVDDLPEKYSAKLDGIRLMVMGRIKRGGTGCYCPEGALLQALLSHLLLQRKDVVILDMEAGIEHLTRGTALGVDKLIVVVEPGRRSIETAQRIFELAKDLHIKNMAVVGNKIQTAEQKQFIRDSLSGTEFLGFIPYDEAIIDADLASRSITDSSLPAVSEVKKIFAALIADSKKTVTAKK
ncbi:MAG TPA: carbon monoxide dehydrogenase accessory protein CooC [Dehalococcoidales bacterium]